MSLMHPLAFDFMRHVAEYNLTYLTTAEFEARLEIFAGRDEAIKAENDKPENTFTLGHNMYSSWTDLELDRIRGYRSIQSEGSFENNTPNADSKNWVTDGCVTPVKD